MYYNVFIKSFNLVLLILINIKRDIHYRSEEGRSKIKKTSRELANPYLKDKKLVLIESSNHK